jgi:sortase A
MVSLPNVGCVIAFKDRVTRVTDRLRSKAATMKFDSPIRSGGDKRRKVLQKVEAVFLVIGIALLILFGIAQLDRGLRSRAALKEFDRHLSQSPIEDREEEAPAPAVDTLSADEKWEMPLAVLQIPKIHLVVPVLDGTDALTLNHAVGRIEGTARPGEPGNIGLAGHRDGFFRGLKDIKIGDSLELKIPQGVDRYIVDRVQVVDPSEVSVLKARGVPSLTLVTCYPFYFIGNAPKRFVVTAFLSQHHSAEAAKAAVQPATHTQIPLGGTMKNHNILSRRLFNRASTSAVLLVLLSAGAWAQDNSTTTVRHGASQFDTDVRNAEVVYVEGNDLVLKFENGKVEHLVVPDNEKFTLNGREVSVGKLMPGAKLTQTITTTTTPRYVNTVRTLKGKVWHVQAPGLVILTLPDGTHQRYDIPSHAKFKIGGRDSTVFDLRKGMTIEATIITDEPHTVVEQSKTTLAQAPPPATPQLLGVLLIHHADPSSEHTVAMASAEHLDSTLPQTGSSIPLIGLLGVLGIGVSAGLNALRKYF